MNGINAIFLTGSITAPDIVSFTDSKTEIESGRLVTFSLATVRSFRGRDGKHQNITDWHEIQIYSSLIIDDVVRNSLKKGDVVSLTGRLEYQNYKNSHNENVKKPIVAVNKNHQFTICPRAPKKEMAL